MIKAALSAAARRLLSDPQLLRNAGVQASRAICERHLADFVRGAWHVIEPTTPLAWNWHLDVICAYLEAFYSGRITRLIFNVPPGSLKSVLVSVMGPAWKWALSPGARIINITNEIGLATRDSLRMRNVIESDWYKARWGERVQLSSDQKEKLHFENTARGFRQGLGVSANITGKRGNYLLLDDLLDAKKAFSDVACQEVNDAYDQAVSSRLNDPANDAICLIMQRLRTNDLTGHLLGKKSSQWVQVRIPMEWDGAPGYDPVRDLGPEYAHLADPRTTRGECFFPARYTPAVLAEMRENWGEYGWAGQAQQQPSPLTGGILKKSYWRVWPDDKPLPTILHCFASWDTAFSERDLTSSAYSACTVWGVWHDERDITPGSPKGRNKLILLSAWWGRVDFPDLIKRAQEIQKDKLTHASDAHLIERKASGISLIQTLSRKPSLRILGYDPKFDGGGDKITRAYRIQPLLEQGLVWIPNKPWAHDAVQIISEFPSGGPPCADLTDTATQAISYLDRGWWIHHPDDEIATQEPQLSALDDDGDDDDFTGRLGSRRGIYG